VAEQSVVTRDTTLAVSRIAGEPVSIAERAQQILEVLRRVVPFEAASISVPDPERKARIALAAVGEVSALHAYCESQQGDEELDAIGLNRPTPPLRHTDLPMPAAETLAWPQYLWPAGFAGAIGVGLFTPDGRHVGHLTVLTDDSTRPTPDDRDLIAAVSRLFAHAVDRMRTIRAAARLVHGAVAGGVLTRGGRVLRLPGMPDHPTLRAGSPAVAEAVERLDAGDAYAVFLHPVPGTAALVRVTVLDCRGDGVDHLRAVVLVSPAPDLRGLCYRELQILGLVVAGRTDEHIASALDMSARDVAECIQRSMYVLAAASRTRLAIRALREGLFLPERLSAPTPR
jgi:DNA-binding CsgD family transcriptional regulator